MHTHCNAHANPTCPHHEPPKVIHDERCQLRRDQRDELKRKALVAFRLFFDPHACPVAVCKAMVEMRDATDFG